jgi:hypothetical protein
MPGGKQSRKREAAIINLLSAGSIEEAARRTGVSDKTLRLWLQEPAFARDYRAARRRILEHAVGLMQKASTSAVLALLRNLSCGKPACEIQAANSLLEKSLQALETYELESRIAALEQKAQQGASHADGSPFPNGEATRGPGR